MSKKITTGRLLYTAAQLTKAAIKKSLNSVPLVIKQRIGLVAFTPTIPATLEDQHAIIEFFTDRVVEEIQEDRPLKAKVLYKLEEWGINVSRETPPSVLKLAIRNTLRNVPPDILLEAGVFGKPCTTEQALKNREEIVEGIYREVLKKGMRTG